MIEVVPMDTSNNPSLQVVSNQPSSQVMPIKEPLKADEPSAGTAPSVPPIDNLNRILPPRRLGSKRGSTIVKRQVSLAKLDSSEPEPSEPTMSTGMSTIRESYVPQPSVRQQKKGRKQRSTRASKRKNGSQINFQGWSRIPSSRSIGTNSSRSIGSNNGPGSSPHDATQGNNNTTSAASHVTVGNGTIVSQPRIHSVNMATGEMIGAADFSTGLYSVAEKPENQNNYSTGATTYTNAASSSTSPPRQYKQEGNKSPPRYRIRPAPPRVTTQETPPPKVMDYGPDDDGPELIDEGNDTIYDLYTEQGKFTPTSFASSQAAPRNAQPAENFLDVSSRLMQDVKGMATQLNSSRVVPSGAPDGGSSLDVPAKSSQQPRDVERQQQPAAPVASRTSTIAPRSSTIAPRASTVARVSIVAANGSVHADHGENQMERKSLGALKTVDMQADRHQRSGKKYGVVCVVVFLLLAGGVIGAAVYFSLEESKKK